MKHIELKYPLLLIHGAGFRDKTMGINYWGRIPRYLAEQGVAVHYGGTDAWGTLESNGEMVKRAILETLDKTGAEKVNIIAHSKGGLEARYAISCLGMDSRVASLTTMSTPHRGVKAMNTALQLPLWLYRPASVLANLWSRILGDGGPDFFRGSRQLAEYFCTEFNRKYPDKPGILYQSYASKLKYFFGDPAYLLTWILVKIFDGDNDGLCPVESAKWGEFRGIITTQGYFGVSHAGILDLYRVPYKGVRIPELYVAIAKELAGKGL
ncbi:esterase/lipase family protein [Leadbettera azotonutricia]|uniref:Hydrolase of alpha/beta superfamily n=1 Tax=Leadbettera azotonutricia (strain ATCC BAA-888 / DSM 13862 / ZAS-9) TaxID=545695 RepID=F5YGG3_LEAAZ|nr:alpha/beta fold hydrolase [Leadbettera azotonutricia]AEF82953.1 hydrolase of alpha/beta superfamily [Leadbettera azotonutricia ZAS-9]